MRNRICNVSITNGSIVAIYRESKSNGFHVYSPTPASWDRLMARIRDLKTEYAFLATRQGITSDTRIRKYPK